MDGKLDCFMRTIIEQLWGEKTQHCFIVRKQAKNVFPVFLLLFKEKILATFHTENRCQWCWWAVPQL